MSRIRVASALAVAASLVAFLLAATPAAAQHSPASRRTVDDTVVATVRAPRKAGVGVALSFLLTGSGQFYAGRPGKGTAHLLAGLVGSGVAVTASDCGLGGACNDGLATAGVVLAVGSWIVSMATAPGDVRAWNARHGLAVAARPFVAPGAGGTAHVGVALALRR